MYQKLPFLMDSVVGCLSKTELHVFKVKLMDANDEKNLRSLSVYSFSSESDTSSLDPWNTGYILSGFKKNMGFFLA